MEVYFDSLKSLKNFLWRSSFWLYRKSTVCCTVLYKFSETRSYSLKEFFMRLLPFGKTQDNNLVSMSNKKNPKNLKPLKTKPLYKITVYVQIKTFVVFVYEWQFRKQFHTFKKHGETLLSMDLIYVFLSKPFL